jgi:hypothetical protein
MLPGELGRLTSVSIRPATHRPTRPGPDPRRVRNLAVAPTPAGRPTSVGLSDGREVAVRIAADRDALDQAYRMLAERYQGRGYDPPTTGGFRFTPHHILPDTITIVAEAPDKRVLATLSLVPDTELLGLPMEGIYGPEVEALRREGRRLAEAVSLADRDLGQRDFVRVFSSMVRLAIQHHLKQGGDTWVIAVNPRHRNYYRKALGFVPFGPPRSYPTVRNHPAEALRLDVGSLRANAPRSYREILEDPLPDSVLSAPPRPACLVRDFVERSTHADRATMLRILEEAGVDGARRRWGDEAEADSSGRRRGTWARIGASTRVRVDPARLP